MTREAARTFTMAVGALVLASAPAFASATPVEGQHHSPRQHARLLPNGDFEDPIAPENAWLTFGQPEVLPGGWHIVGTVDVVNTQYFQAGHGQQSVDLNGASTGGVWRDLQTRPGQRYTVRFLYSGNPDVGACGEPLVKTMVVTAGDRTRRFSYDTTGRTLADPGWSKGKVSFRATDDTTRLEFQSQVGSCAGPLIDYVKLTPLKRSRS